MRPKGGGKGEEKGKERRRKQRGEEKKGERKRERKRERKGEEKGERKCPFAVICGTKPPWNAAAMSSQRVLLSPPPIES